MLSQQQIEETKRTRHHIREITLTPTTSIYDITIAILIGGKKLHELPKLKKNQILRWSGLCLLCDMDDTSAITMQTTEIHTISVRNKVELHTYQVSQAVGKPILSIAPASHTNDRNKYTVELKLTDDREDERAYEKALEYSRNIETKPGMLIKHPRVRRMLKVMLQLGTIVADQDQTGGAKIAVALCMKVWEYLEEQIKLEEDVEDLIEKLADMIPSIEYIRRVADAHLLITVGAMVDLIENVSLFVLNYKSKNMWENYLLSITDSATPHERMKEFITKFEYLRREFDTRIGVQTLGEVAAEAIRLKLMPASRAGYDPARICMLGTRASIIQNIITWIDQPNQVNKMGWVYGLAGLGKSSIAASICQELDKQGKLGASFFCKRDISDLRNPCQVLKSIAYSLAVRCKPYGDGVRAALQADPELHTQNVLLLYDGLLAKPLHRITEWEQPEIPLTIMIDALDECKGMEDRDIESWRTLLTCLQGMSQIGPWLKVVVTSRPDADIQKYFDEDAAGSFERFNLLNYDAVDDVRAFIEAQLSSLRQNDKWLKDAAQKLAEHSGGLFQWARTACTYIKNGFDPQTRLKQILTRADEDELPAGLSQRLDNLYALAINTATVDEGKDNFAVIKWFLGVIVATATRRPLSISSLTLLLHRHKPQYRLDYMLSNLTSVLYVDPELDGAVRVSHPSFIDYITDERRSKDLCVNQNDQNAILAKCCLETMIAELEFNMCKLETSDVLNKNVPDLDMRVRDRIKPHLSYSCIYWMSHLAQTSGDRLVRSLTAFLFGCKLLYWIEALSLLKMLSIAPRCMLEMIPEECQTYARDVYRFILSSYDAITMSTPHLYVSALPLAPMKSLIAQRMRPHFPNTFAITQGAEQDWTPCIRVISVASDVNSVSWSGDGHRIATASDDGTVRVWDAETGTALLKPIRGHSEKVRAIAFSPDSRCIVSGSDDKTVQVWDAETGALVLGPLRGHSGSVRSVAFSPDGSLIASGSYDNTVQVWNASTGNVISILHGHSDAVYSAAFSPDGYRIASGSSDFSVRVWDINTCTEPLQPLTGHRGWVFSVMFSSDGGRIISGSDDCTTRLWDAETGKALLELKGNTFPVLSVLFSPDDRFIFSSSDDGAIRTWDTETGTLVSGPFLGHSGIVRSIARSPDGRRIVSGSYDKTVRIWDVGPIDTGAVAPQGHSDQVRCTVFSPDGSRVASCSNDKTIRIWDRASGAAVLNPMQGHSRVVLSIAYSPDGQFIVSGSRDNTVRIWDANTGDAMLEPLRGHLHWVKSVAFSPDGMLIASGADDLTVRLWDVSTGASLLEPLEGHSSSVNCVAFSPNSQYLVSGSKDRTVWLWDVRSGMAMVESLCGHPDEVRAVTFSSDGKCIVSASEDLTIRLSDATTGMTLHQPLRVNPYQGLYVVFSPDGLRVLSFFQDDTIRIWDVETGALLCEPLQGHTTNHTIFLSRSAAFSPNSNHVVSGSGDNTVRIWDIDTCANADTSARRLLPGTNFPLISNCPDSRFVSTSAILARRVNRDGWTMTNDGGLYCWLPTELRRIDHSTICISKVPLRGRVVMDFTKFVHGHEWAAVARL